jgi:hypothetical protein
MLSIISNIGILPCLIALVCWLPLPGEEILIMCFIWFSRKQWLFPYPQQRICAGFLGFCGSEYCRPHTRSNVLANMPVHAQKNQSLIDLLQAKPKTVQGRKFYHTRTVLPDILELRRQNGAFLCVQATPRWLQTGSIEDWNDIVGSLPRLLT